MIQKDLFSIQFIDIVSVENSLPISHYSVNEIDTLAANYLECGGNINPIIVERTGLDEYRVVEGDLALYAAQRAKEKNRFFEMIRAIILDKNNEQFVNEQINLLGKTPTLPPGDLPVKLDVDPGLIRLENSLLAKMDSLNQKVDDPFNIKIIQRLEDLEKTFLAKFDELAIKLDMLQQKSVATPPREIEKPNINKMSVPELKIEAKRRGLSGYSKFKKAELMALLSQE